MPDEHDGGRLAEQPAPAQHRIARTTRRRGLHRFGCRVRPRTFAIRRVRDTRRSVHVIHLDRVQRRPSRDWRAGRRLGSPPAAPTSRWSRTAPALRLRGQRSHVRMLDLPATRHLLDHELGVHPHLEQGVWRVLQVELETGDQAAILGDVVRGMADRLCSLRNHLAAVGVTDQRTEAGRTGITPRATVGLDDDVRMSHLGRAQIPDSWVRTRMRLHSSQRITSSLGASAIRARSAAPTLS